MKLLKLAIYSRFFNSHSNHFVLGEKKILEALNLILCFQIAV